MNGFWTNNGRYIGGGGHLRESRRNSGIGAKANDQHDVNRSTENHGDGIGDFRTSLIEREENSETIRSIAIEGDESVDAIIINGTCSSGGGGGDPLGELTLRST